MCSNILLITSQEHKTYYQIQNRRLTPWTLVVVTLLGRPPVHGRTHVARIRLGNFRRSFDYDRGFLRRSPARSIETGER
jgi:hypothetical protein